MRQRVEDCGSASRACEPFRVRFVERVSGAVWSVRRRREEVSRSRESVHALRRPRSLTGAEESWICKQRERKRLTGFGITAALFSCPFPSLFARTKVQSNTNYGVKLDEAIDTVAEKLPLIGWTAGEKSAVVDHPNDHVNTTSPRT